MNQLQKSDKSFDVILNNMSDGILEINQNEKIVYANKTAISLLGIPEKKLITSNFIDIFDGVNRERIKQLLEINDQEPQWFDGNRPLKLNNKIISMGIFPVKEQDKKSMIIMLNDITEHNNIKTQLQQAQKMEAIGTMSSGIAHDFNNILMGIQGNISIMLLDIDSSNKHYNKLNNIQQHIANGAGLTKQLLNLAKGGTNEIRPVNLNKLIQKQNQMFSQTRKDITIHEDYDQNIYTPEVDKGQIEQVLLNLYINAWQAMAGCGELRIKTQNVVLNKNYALSYQVKDGKYAKISITDSGEGMDEKTLKKIFNPFFTTKTLNNGTGLGLATAYEIIKKHGGIIKARSNKGKGTTFDIYLPVSGKEAIEESNDSGTISKSSETILLVDDEEMIIDINRQMLEEMGYNVITAETSKKAIEIIDELYNPRNRTKVTADVNDDTRKHEPDLVMLDMVMPDMDGYEVYSKMKEINPEIKVLLVSGYCTDKKIGEILKNGGKGFLQKPFDMVDLSQAIRNILD